MHYFSLYTKKILTIDFLYKQVDVQNAHFKLRINNV